MIRNQIKLGEGSEEYKTLRTEATIGLKWTDQSRFYGALTDVGRDNNNQPVATITNTHQLSYVWTNTASYNVSVKDAHNWSFLLGQEINHSQGRSNGITNRYFPRAFTAREAWNNMGFGTPYQSPSSLSTADHRSSVRSAITGSTATSSRLRSVPTVAPSSLPATSGATSPPSLVLGSSARSLG